MSKPNLAPSIPHQTIRQHKASDTVLPAVSPDIQQAIAQLTAGDFHQKWNSVKQLSNQFVEWGDRAIPPLIEQLQVETSLENPNPENQGFLIRILSQFNRPAVVEAIATLLVNTHDLDVQTEATKALTKLGSSAIQTLAQQLNAPSIVQQTLAARALSRIRRTPIIEPLLPVATHPDETLRAIAIEALGSFHDPRIIPILITAVEDKPAISKEAIRALSRRSDLIDTVDLVSPLSQALQSPEITIAKESAIALGRLGTTEALSALARLLSQPKPTKLKVVAVRALGWNNSRIAVEALAEAFSYTAPKIADEARLEIARSLGQTHISYLQSLAAEPLILWLKSLQVKLPHQSSLETSTASQTNHPLKQAVILSLSRLGATDAIDPLVALLNDADARIRMHAQSALRQIDPDNSHLLDRG